MGCIIRYVSTYSGGPNSGWSKQGNFPMFESKFRNFTNKGM